jgi:hypothetical protein
MSVKDKWSNRKGRANKSSTKHTGGMAIMPSWFKGQRHPDGREIFAVWLEPRDGTQYVCCDPSVLERADKRLSIPDPGETADDGYVTPWEQFPSRDPALGAPPSQARAATLRLTQMQGLEMAELIKVTWGSLGSPTTPREVQYQGKTFIVRFKDIEASRGDPTAIFTATLFEPLSGRAQYHLGSVEFPG